MLIASRFQRPNAPIELPNANGTTTTYFFKPIDPNVPNSEHVAEVSDLKHAQRLLSITEGYYISEHAAALDSAAQAAANNTTRPVVPPPPPPAPAAPEVASAATQPAVSDPAGTQAGDAAADATAATDATGLAESARADLAGTEAAKDAQKDNTPVLEAAEKLLALPASQIKAQAGKTPKDVLTAALAIETGKGEHERQTVSKHIRGALGG